MTSRQSDPGWYSDPTGRYMYRYWNGTQWTSQTNSGGANASDPIEESASQVPPVPGSQVADPSAPPQQQPTTVVSQSSGTSFGIIIAVIAVIAVLVILIVVLVNNNGGNGPDTTSVAPATITPTTPATITPTTSG